MIVDLERFVARRRSQWEELDRLLTQIEEQPEDALDLQKAERLHYLYERTAADLAQIQTFSSEAGTRRSLEALVGRAYAEIHSSAAEAGRFSFREWFGQPSLASSARSRVPSRWLWR